MTDSLVCSIGGGKGGVGKSTFCINVGTVLAQNGYDVIVVDADLALPTIGRMLSIDTDATLHGVLAEEESLSNAFATTRDGLRVLPGNPSLEAYPDAKASNISDVILQIRKSFDVVLVDVSAAISDATFNSYVASDGVILVSLPTDVSLDDSEKAARLVKKAEKSVYGIVLNQLSTKHAMNRVEDTFDFPLIGVIPEYDDGILPHPIVTTASDSPTAEAYNQVGGRIESLASGGKDSMPDSPTLKDSWFSDANEDSNSTEEDEDTQNDEDNDGLIL